MKFVNSIPQSFFTGAGLLRTPNMRGGAAPRPLHSSLDAGAPPCTRVTFSPMRKSPKNLQGLRPLEPAGAKSPPFSRSLRCAPARAGLVSATEKDRFATLRWWANRSLLFPLALTRKNILLLIRGAGAPRGRCGCTFGCNFWGDSGYR